MIARDNGIGKVLDEHTFKHRTYSKHKSKHDKH